MKGTKEIPAFAGRQALCRTPRCGQFATRDGLCGHHAAVEARRRERLTPDAPEVSA